MPPPPLKFLEEWKRLTADIKDDLEPFERLHRENVVFHAGVVQIPGATQRRLFWGYDTTEKGNDMHQ